MASNSNTFLDLGIFHMMNGEFQKRSILSYSNLFTILYNGYYLSNEMSQLSLELLSESTYKDGLVAGVPAGTRVAHKFGFYNPPTGESQLHDCGIVYHPRTPYVLCVMTSGPNIESEEAAISAISHLVYTSVDGM